MAPRMHISKEAMTKYSELIKETPVPGISNEKLASMVTPEEVAEALDKFSARIRRAKRTSARRVSTSHAVAAG